MTKQRAISELIFAGALWGFGFVAATWSLQSFSASEVLFYRFFLALLFGECFNVLILKRPSSLYFWRLQWSALKAPAIAGFFLGGMLLLQTIGLETTTATKSGFITSLYVVFIPIIHSLLWRKRPQWKVLFHILIAVIGMLLLLGKPETDWTRGDFWTLLCSLFAAGHIIYLGYHTKKQPLDAVTFNNQQTFTALIFLMPLLLTQNSISFTGSALAWGGLAFLGVCGSFLAFTIQVRAQKVLSDTTASMLFLLESPFAFLFGFLLLGEQLNPLQFLGAIFIMIASLLTILNESKIRH